jgi:hypothetical protein
MTKDNDGQGGDYLVGYGRPPAEHQFKKGKSGNPAGRPKRKKAQSVDAAAILNESLLVQTAGGQRTMPTYEVVVRRLVERAVKRKDLRAMIEFLKLCETYRLLVSPELEEIGGVYRAPKDVDFRVWTKEMRQWHQAAMQEAEEDEFD